LSEHVFIGMIILAGTVVNNSTVMIDRYNQLKSTLSNRYSLLIRAGEDRLRPIAMTTVSSVLGFTPMAVGMGQSSNLWSPLAITVIGGLVSSSILTLYIIPVVLLIAGDIGRSYVFMKGLVDKYLGIIGRFINPRRLIKQ